MAFTIAITTVSTDATYFNVDITMDNRINYGVLPYVQIYLSSAPTVGLVATNDPLTVESWAVGSVSNARYKVTGYAFNNEANATSSEGEYRINTGGQLQKYSSGAWADANFDDDARTAAEETSNVLDQPILSQAYLQRNTFNLDYVKQVQADMANGTAYQGGLYYGRTNLDYTSALIDAAEYNWGLAAYSNYYDICITLNQIIADNVQQ